MTQTTIFDLIRATGDQSTCPYAETLADGQTLCTYEGRQAIVSCGGGFSINAVHGIRKEGD